MEFPIKFDTVKSGWSIVYIKGLQVIIFSKKNLSLMIDLVFKPTVQPLMKCRIMQKMKEFFENLISSQQEF